MIAIPAPYQLAAKAIGSVLSLALLVLLVWWVAIKPRGDLADERTAHQATKVAHAEVMARIAQASEEVARKAAHARDEYLRGKDADDKTHDEEVKHAFQRGKAAALAIRAGDVSVRPVWRERDCPQAVPGQSAGPGPGPEAVPAGRADAIGRVLGYGGAWDADYALAMSRLGRAQQLLNACYEDGAP